jgi:hypothetical protein
MIMADVAASSDVSVRANESWTQGRFMMAASQRRAKPTCPFWHSTLQSRRSLIQCFESVS